jgi:hypothetical protein
MGFVSAIDGWLIYRKLSDFWQQINRLELRNNKILRRRLAGVWS